MHLYYKTKNPVELKFCDMSSQLEGIHFKRPHLASFDFMTVLTLRKYSIEEKLKKAGMEATKSVVTSGGFPSYTKSTI